MLHEDLRAAGFAVLVSKNAMFQASLALGVMVVAYGLHAKHQPFVTAVEQGVAVMRRALASGGGGGGGGGAPEAASKEAAGGSGRALQAVGLHKARRAPVVTRRSSIVALEGAAAAAAAAITETVIDFNVLEVRARVLR